MKNFIIAIVCLGFIGCAPTYNNLIEKPFVEPQYGMTKLQLLDLVGRPESIEIYKKTDHSQIVFYIYIKKYVSSEEKVPVCLINNKVVGWGKAFYEDHISMDDIRIK